MEKVQIRGRQHNKHQDFIDFSIAHTETIVPAVQFLGLIVNLQDHKAEEKGSDRYRLSL